MLQRMQHHIGLKSLPGLWKQCWPVIKNVKLLGQNVKQVSSGQAKDICIADI